MPYPAELRDTAVDGAALAGLTEQTGGRVVGDVSALFQRRPEARSPRYDPVWPWFVALGLGLFLIDIALRLGHAAAPAVRLRRLLPR